MYRGRRKEHSLYNYMKFVSRTRSSRRLLQFSSMRTAGDDLRRGEDWETRMSIIKFAASTAIILTLTESPASAHLGAAATAPDGVGLGWQAWRTPDNPAPARIAAPRLGISGTYWSSGQQERVSPHR